MIIYVTPNDPNAVDPNSALPDPSRGNDGGMEEDQSGSISSGVAPAEVFSKDDKKKIKGALKKAQDFVKSGQCDKALQAYGIKSLAKLVALYGSPDDFTSLLDGRVSQVTSHTEMINGVSVDVTIAADLSNSKAPTAAITLGGNVYLGMLFFDPQKFGVTDSIYNEAARALILIHEAVHAFGKAGDSAFPGGSLGLSKLIIDKCDNKEEPYLGGLVKK